jgi:hypothetical protein
MGLIFDANAFKVEMALSGNLVLPVSISKPSLLLTHLHIMQDVLGSQKTKISPEPDATTRQLTTETDGTHKSDIDHIVMAETDRPEINRVLGWHCERFMTQSRRSEVDALLVSWFIYSAPSNKHVGTATVPLDRSTANTHPQ